ncbi:hypothetical protein SU69_01175 [Thermosipho melanesiensis]|uniref:Integral membrane protein-like protein n=2 Tax=Thermosipho melanesiensis TaxID=46541 RepID=A6LJJ3_THEM4|nr:lysylphosphatidylglycerol synthase transmembrane domain-containing protein [Thermosipho melanesiensis]ABR30094.1 hypothetical protein Tmel_0220 [Thermosipho melanesiensis BI429]APT73291.1 hypothetical protein BW47_01215 [Thermosipho melanesiensis]OOC38682.1 hypothetical protein SU68_01175 [Thermosipho melanesiensis]OOC40486.1 hypothetical protein SU70_01175 [Thermosipho melanesiensis]OOC40751.1 hypothetical protein SU69_01175 [Thermosipho melanesiensis]
MKEKNKIVIGIILSILISGVVLFFYSFSLNKNIINSIFFSLNYEKFIVAIILVTLSFVFDGVKHFIVFRILDQKIGIFPSINSCFVTGYFSSVTPFSVGGQPFQIYYLNKKGVDSAYATQVVLLRLFEMISLMFFIDLSYIIFFSHNITGISQNIIFLGLILTFLSSIVILLGIAFPKTIGKLLRVLKKVKILSKIVNFDKIEHWFHKLDIVIKKIFREHKWLIFIDFIMMFILLIFQSYVFYYSIKIFTNINIPFFKFFSIVNIVNAVAFLVPTPGASGSFEIIYTNVFSSFSPNKEAIIKGVLFYRFLSYYLLIIFGTIILLPFAFKKDKV